MLSDPRDAPHLDLLRLALETVAAQVEAVDLPVDRARIWDIATSYAPALYRLLPEAPPPEAFD